MIPVFIAFLMAIFAILSASLKPVIRFRVFEKKGAYSGDERRSGYGNYSGRGNGNGQGASSGPGSYSGGEVILVREGIRKPGL